MRRYHRNKSSKFICKKHVRIKNNSTINILIFAIFVNLLALGILIFLLATNSSLFISQILTVKQNTNPYNVNKNIVNKNLRTTLLLPILPFPRIREKLAYCQKFNLKDKNLQLDNNFNNILIDYVKYIIDGDTIVTKCNHKVRLASIDTPETTSKQQAFGISALNLTKKLILHKPIILVIPQISYPYDKYHRLIALVFTTNELSLNNELVKQGLAMYIPFQIKDAFNYILEQSQKTAKKQKIGIWQIY